MFIGCVIGFLFIAVPAIVGLIDDPYDGIFS